MISDFEQMILPITEFRSKMAKILDDLKAPRILMNRDKPKAVLVPYDLYKAMEEALEDQFDHILAATAHQRVMESEEAYLSHHDFWSDMEIDD